jgi:nucleoside-diphosphate-sugar epimerase
MPFDISSAQRALGYTPRSLADGLAETIDWLREQSHAEQAA